MISQQLQALLVQRDLVSPDQIRQAVTATRGTGWSWLERLVVFGQLDEDELCRHVAAAYRMPRCPPEALARVSQAVIGLVPSEVAGEHRAVPLGLNSDGDLRVAMTDPTDEFAVREIEFFSQCTVIREVARATDVAEALLRYYGIAGVLWPRASVADRARLTAVQPAA